MTSYSVDDPFGLAADHTDEERLITDTVRDWVRRRFLPIVIDRVARHRIAPSAARRRRRSLACLVHIQSRTAPRAAAGSRVLPPSRPPSVPEHAVVLEQPGAHRGVVGPEPRRNSAVADRGAVE